MASVPHLRSSGRDIALRCHRSRQSGRSKRHDRATGASVHCPPPQTRNFVWSSAFRRQEAMAHPNRLKAELRTGGSARMCPRATAFCPRCDAGGGVDGACQGRCRGASAGPAGLGRSLTRSGLEFRLQVVRSKPRDLPRKRGTPNPDDHFVKNLTGLGRKLYALPRNGLPGLMSGRAGWVAQLVEQRTENQKSSLPYSTVL